ncbi:MAG: hypothetical protein GWM92_21835 [Gemmatimonadetes bacterium]|nr:helix-turn-helix transcriptional regulator [Gemmatimonadota bacterium]NIR81488.1 helix-turn-helix transcriptional regulator [Gemmatimonadota bacterium]NIT90335.1 helix-turn-helix transcriptional regulator [Gemmatimonadota bacterium]NIU34160.1 helix-turn-helix transcriptional regulator [Gemmatimonadota bacterium]NIU38311.1 hypothetical protein [Gemmatimonadota bacterium]
MPSLVLREGERARLAECIRTLVSPFDHADLDRWRSAVNRRVGSLLGADQATFELPGVDGVRLYSEELDADLLRKYHTLLEPLGRRYRIFQRYRKLKVTNRTRLWAEHLDEYYRSEYYGDLVVPLRAYDGLFAYTTLRDGRDSVLYFHHDRPQGRRFGDRGVQILRLLFPAFHAGVSTYVEMRRARSSLVRAVDREGGAAALFDEEGRPVHRSPRLEKLLARADDAAAVEGQMARSAAAVVAAAVGGVVDANTTSSPARTIAVGSRRYALVTTLLGEHLLGRPYALLTLKPEAVAPLPTPAALRERFDLTPRQAEVALLLARRRTNAEIAEALGISPHTARRHTEKVLLKLGISSRRKVRRVIRGLRDRSGPGEKEGRPR